MFERMLRGLRRHPKARPAPAPDAQADARASGEDARRSAQMLADEATIAGTPRLKARNL